MAALRGFALLLLCQAVGEALVRALALPLPGPVIGLVLVLAALRWPAVRDAVAPAADVLLANLSLLFVPVGVGVITHLDLIVRHGIALAAAVVLSTWIGMAVAAAVLRRLLAAREKGGTDA